MLQFLVNYAVPFNLVLLMLVAGTEVRRSEFFAFALSKAVFVGAVGPLLLLPVVALAIVYAINLHPVVAAGLVILALCPGGGISNTYCQLARCSVLLSALITAASAIVCLLTIPAWIVALPILGSLPHVLAPPPATTVLGQLFALLVIPLAVGALARELVPGWVDRSRKLLRSFSVGLVAAILATTVATVAYRFPELVRDIAVAAGLFIAFAMMLGTILAARLNNEERHVITIETGVRNIGLALSLGAMTMSTEDFAILATFLAGYLAAEIFLVMPFAFLIGRGQVSQSATVRPSTPPRPSD